MGFNWVISFMPYGTRFRERRAFIHRFLQPSVLHDYIALQTEEVHRMLRDILDSPSGYDKHVQR